MNNNTQIRSDFDNDQYIIESLLDADKNFEEGLTVIDNTFWYGSPYSPDDLVNVAREFEAVLSQQLFGESAADSSVG